MGAARKYLLYAVGEIALVVIGILIALQINNANEWMKSLDTPSKEQREPGKKLGVLTQMIMEKNESKGLIKNFST